MFRKADVLTIISSEKKAAKSSHSILSGELCQFSYKKVYSLLLRNISKKHTTIYFMQYMTYFCLFCGYAVNGISGKTDLVY
jgi:hypothetical protein